MAAYMRFVGLRPTKCPECGGLSTEPIWVALILQAVWTAGLGVAALYALRTWSWWPIAVGVGLLVALNISVVHVFPLQPTTPTISGKEHRALTLGVVLIIAAIAIVGIVKPGT